MDMDLLYFWNPELVYKDSPPDWLLKAYKCNEMILSMGLFDFLQFLKQEKYAYTLEPLEWRGTVKVIVDLSSRFEIYEFDSSGVIGLTELKPSLDTEDQALIQLRLNRLKDRAARCWAEAAEDLGFTFLSPYQFMGVDQNIYQATGLLPEFGYGKGVLIVTRKDEDDVFKMAELSGDYFLSILNPASYEEYDRELFVETLSDWGWRAETEKPKWLSTND